MGFKFNGFSLATSGSDLSILEQPKPFPVPLWNAIISSRNYVPNCTAGVSKVGWRPHCCMFTSWSPHPWLMRTSVTLSRGKAQNIQKYLHVSYTTELPRLSGTLWLTVRTKCLDTWSVQTIEVFHYTSCPSSPSPSKQVSLWDYALCHWLCSFWLSICNHC